MLMLMQKLLVMMLMFDVMFDVDVARWIDGEVGRVGMESNSDTVVGEAGC
jgi:hypothetical protein